ncbi:hypothetical protein HPB50_028971 [Hyalomma asiaticum]|nr:hypothetical protein HPB50_028971 [Hyalomma asiaticum]
MDEKKTLVEIRKEKGLSGEALLAWVSQRKNICGTSERKNEKKHPELHERIMSERWHIWQQTEASSRSNAELQRHSIRTRVLRTAV